MISNFVNLLYQSDDKGHIKKIRSAQAVVRRSSGQESGRLSQDTH